MQTTKLYVQLYENNIETVWKKKNFLESTPPPSPEIPRPLTPHPSGISNPFRGGGGVWIFSGTTQCQKMKERLEKLMFQVLALKCFLHLFLTCKYIKTII